MPAGFVYVMASPSMPGIYKIGMTRRSPEERAKQLSGSTGVCEPFVVLQYIKTDRPEELERCAHNHLHGDRVNCSREFFATDFFLIDDFFATLAFEHPEEGFPELFPVMTDAGRVQRREDIDRVRSSSLIAHFLSQEVDPIHFDGGRALA